LQGLIESAAWLVREAENFAHSMILLKQARNVKFKRFLAPGERITYIIAAKALEEKLSSFKGHGESEGHRVVEATFTLRHFNLADRNDSFAAADAEVIESLKSRWKLLCL
jgi:3-hydroxyacyl-[acyl-carrier-protein] dehydratase